MRFQSRKKNKKQEEEASLFAGPFVLRVNNLTLYSSATNKDVGFSLCKDSLLDYLEWIIQNFMFI
jgi:hypothetical protein